MARQSATVRGLVFRFARPIGGMDGGLSPGADGRDATADRCMLCF